MVSKFLNDIAVITNSIRPEPWVWVLIAIVLIVIILTISMGKKGKTIPQTILRHDKKT